MLSVQVANSDGAQVFDFHPMSKTFKKRGVVKKCSGTTLKVEPSGHSPSFYRVLKEDGSQTTSYVKACDVAEVAYA